MRSVIALLLVFFFSLAHGQDAWPSRPIRFILPFPPGGGIGIPAAAPHIKAGRLRALALVAPQRSSALPEVPTVAEAGLRDFEVTTWYGVLAPAGTPRNVVTRLNDELVKIMHAPE